MISDKQIGAMVAYLRTNRGFSQKRLAEGMGVSQVSVARFEAGQQRISVPDLWTVLCLLTEREDGKVNAKLAKIKRVIDSES